MRRPLLVANWKMHKTVPEATGFVKALRPLLDGVAGVDLLVAPAFTELASLKPVLWEGLGLAAQNLHWEPEGAFTGEVSARMLVDAGCSHVIVGHSERRHLFGETDAMVRQKVAAAVDNGLTPILCVGETLAERERGETLDVLERQLLEAVKDLPEAQAARLVVAYEPVWAIGTGKTATPELAQEAHAFLRDRLARRLGREAAQRMRILYGGSVKPDNLAGLVAQPDIDGALVGGASLQPESFARLARACARAA